MSSTDPGAQAPTPTMQHRPRRVAVAALVALGVATAICVFGLLNPPDYGRGLFGHEAAAAYRLKSQLATAVLVLALMQLALAGWMYGVFSGARARPRTVPVLHRVGGAGLFLLSVPIALHCLLTYGLQLASPRTAVHSLLGCFFYGAFAAKVILVRSHRLPGWALPVTGGLLVVLVGVLWYSSVFWYWSGAAWPFT
ncbi:MAG: DUF6529 family protein [Humibacillus sp.]|nr:DUF6529 family protein [Humibacillus sp.]MDN5777768.1 DUF6529 family protein [Humibacillus sp.]